VGVARRVKQCVDLRHAHALEADCDPDNLVTGLYFSFLDDTEIETGPAVLDEQRCHFRLVHADAHAVTRDARLRHLEKGAADPVAVPDAHLGVGHAFNGEILAKLSVSEFLSTELVLPISIGLNLIDKYGTVLPAGARHVALTVAVDVEPAHHARACNRRFPDACMDGFALPRDVTRQADID
jgi:hypothetical protein